MLFLCFPLFSVQYKLNIWDIYLNVSFDLRSEYGELILQVIFQSMLLILIPL